MHSDVWLIYLLYGAAFVLMGGVLGVQARSPVRVLPGRSMWLLAAFGLLHGSVEWCSLSLLIEGSVNRRLVCGGLLAVSFAVLLEFVAEVQISLRRWPWWARLFPAVVLLLQGLVAQVLPQTLADPIFNLAVRYTAALPGAGLACFALLAVRRTMTGSEHARQRRYLVIAATAFAAYAILAGMLGPKGSLPVAAVLNSNTFLELTNVPVEVLRAGCAAVIGISLTEAFVVESARAHAHAERLREEFISVVAHDLRGPIGTIELLASRLQRASSTNPAEAKAGMDSIRNQIRALERMIRDLLDASRIEAKRLVLQCQPLDLAKLVAEVADSARPISGGHAIELEVGEGAAHVLGDPVRLQQVLMNLISNAAKYAYPETTIAVKLRPQRSGILVSVTNSGPSIPADAVPHLFERFYRAGGTRGAVPGIGLGLYLARGLVEAHGGCIWLEPQRGDPTTFSFMLPRLAS